MAHNEAETQKLITELEQFNGKFDYYRGLVLTQKGLETKRLTLPNKQLREIQELKVGLQRKYGSLKEVIERYGSSTKVPLEGGQREYEAFIAAFSYTQFSLEALILVMDTATTAINTAIGNLEKLPLPETGQVQAPADSTQLANFLFDKMQFHPKVIQVSKHLFKDGHYAQAILEAFKAVNNLVKEKTVLALDGRQLMARAFDERDPFIKLNEDRTQSDKNEQEGFKFLFMGAMQGIRNPKAHDNIVQTDPYRTLEYLGFASLLMKRAEEGTVKRPRKKQAKSLKS